MGVDYYFWPGWRSAFTYSWFDFSVEDELPGFSTLLLPNAPVHRFSLALGYDRGRVDADFNVRWVDDFRWGVGPFQGDVESYTTADVTAHYDVGKRVILGLNIANLFDDKHWESFG